MSKLIVILVKKRSTEKKIELVTGPVGLRSWRLSIPGLSSDLASPLKEERPSFELLLTRQGLPNPHFSILLCPCGKKKNKFSDQESSKLIA